MDGASVVEEVVALALRHRSSEVRVEALRTLNRVCTLVTRTRLLGSAISSYSFKITHDPGRRARTHFLNFFSVHVVRHGLQFREFALDGFVVHLLLELVHRRGVERLDTRRLRSLGDGGSVLRHALSVVHGQRLTERLFRLIQGGDHDFDGIVSVAETERLAQLGGVLEKSSNRRRLRVRAVDGIRDLFSRRRDL